MSWHGPIRAIVRLARANNMASACIMTTRAAVPLSVSGSKRLVRRAATRRENATVTDNVIPWRGITRNDSDPQRVLDAAIEAGLAGVVVMGYTAEGAEYFASSYADGGDVLWHLERSKHKLLRIVDAEDS